MLDRGAEAAIVDRPVVRENLTGKATCESSFRETDGRSFQIEGTASAKSPEMGLSLASTAEAE